MKILPIQQSFSAGEITPKMHGRSDTDGYAAGVATMLNMVADSRGPAVSRKGTYFVDSYSGQQGRIETVQINAALFFSLIFLQLKLVISTPAGELPAEQHILNPFFSDGASDWTADTSGSNSSVTFSQTDCSLVCGQSAPDYSRVDQNFTVSDPTVEHILSVASTFGEDPTELLITVGTTQGASDIYSGATSQQVFNVPVTPGSGNTDLWIRIENTESDTDVSLHKIMFYSPVDGPIEFVTPWPENEVEALHLVAAPGGKSLYFFHPSYATQKLVYDPDTASFSFAAVTFLNASSTWTGSNWPGTGTFFEGRLWAGGTPDDPETFWGSKSGIPEDFDVGDSSAADDALEFTLAQYGRIEWMNGFKNLVIGTENGEHIVTSDAGVITPSDVQVTQQSSYGSNSVQPTQVGDQIFYISSDSRKIRAMNYEWQADNWLSKDLTFTSDHITLSGIRDIAWAQNPDNLFWCVLNDGTLACLTYERGNNIFGWHRHDTQGEIVSMSVGSFQGTSLVSLLVRRADNTLYHESFFPPVELDSAITVTLAPATTTVTGLDHLDGYTCQVIADGAVHPDAVVASGTIELQTEASQVTVGLKYEPTVVTLPFDKGDRAGSGMGRQKHWNKIFVRTLDSAKPKINGTRPPSRSPSTPMGTMEPLSSEDIIVHALGRDRYAQVTIVQDLPLPLTVLAIFGEIAQEKL